MSTNAFQGDNRPVSSRTIVPGTITWANVVYSEWTKLWTVRSTTWILLAMFAVTVGLSGLFSSMTVRSSSHDMEQMRLDPTGTSLSGIWLGQILITMLGVMSITMEYTSGSIRTSLIAVPQRLKLLGAKTIVLAGVALVSGVTTSFAAFFLGQAIFATEGIDASFGNPDVARAVLGGGLFLAGSALFGFALGAVLRSTAIGITVAVATLKVLPELARQLPGTWGEWAEKVLTSNAGQQVMQVNPMDNQLGPWTGYLVFTLWWILILSIAAVLMQIRDA